MRSKERIKIIFDDRVEGLAMPHCLIKNLPFAYQLNSLLSQHHQQVCFVASTSHDLTLANRISIEVIERKKEKKELM